MDTKQALKEFQDYFTEIEWNDHAVNKVKGILNGMSTKTVVKKETVIKYKYVHINRELTLAPEAIDFDAIAERVCEVHKVPSWVIYSKSRKTEYVHARADFVWRVKNRNPGQTLTSIGKYMRRDHSSVLHLINGIHDGKYRVGIGEEL